MDRIGANHGVSLRHPCLKIPYLIGANERADLDLEVAGLAWLDELQRAVLTLPGAAQCVAVRRLNAHRVVTVTDLLPLVQRVELVAPPAQR